MANLRRHRANAGSSLETISQTHDITDGSAVLRPATRSLRDVLDERDPLTGPVTDAGTRALLAVRGERPGDGHGGR